MKSVLFFLLTFGSFNLFAQDTILYCGTNILNNSTILNSTYEESNSQPRWGWGKTINLPEPTETYYFRLRVILVRKDNGSSRWQPEFFTIDPNNHSNFISLNNQWFLPYKIQFSEIELVIVDNSQFYDCNDADADSLSNLYSNPNAINIFMVGTLTTKIGPSISLVAGFADVNQNKIFLSDDSVFPHEFGHALGLDHTFGGVEKESIDQSGQNGCPINNWYAGDKIMDTPADYDSTLWEIKSGLIIPADACGNKNYQPDKQNVMSYWSSYPKHFSNHQVRVIHHLIPIFHSRHLTNNLSFNFFAKTTSSSGSSLFNIYAINRIWLNANNIPGMFDPNSNILHWNLHKNKQYKLEVVGSIANYSTEGHHDWNGISSDFKSSKEISWTEEPITYNSQRRPLNNVVFTSLTTDGITFENQSLLSDPWYADANGNQDLGFLPVTSTRAVFKNEEPNVLYPNKPVYKIRSDQVKTVNANLKLAFLRWETVGTNEITTTSPAPQTIVFTGNTPSVTAHYKAILGSNTAGWVNGNQYVSYNGTSSVLYKTNNQLWLHTENGTSQAEALIEDPAAAVTAFSVTTNGAERFVVVQYTDNTVNIYQNSQSNHLASFQLPFSINGTVSVVRISDPYLPNPYLFFAAQSGAGLRYFTADIINGTVSIPATPTWSTLNLTGYATAATPITVTGNGQMATFTWIYNGKVYGVHRKKAAFSAITLLYNNTSGNYLSHAASLTASDNLRLVLVRQSLSGTQRSLGTGQWLASGSLSPFTVLETGSGSVQYQPVSLSNDGAYQLASIGKTTNGTTWSYHLWQHNGTHWTPYAISLGNTARKTLHNETEVYPVEYEYQSGGGGDGGDGGDDPSIVLAQPLILLKSQPIEWGQGIGIEKISNASDGHSFSIVARPLDDTLEYYFSINPSELDSVVIDTLGVWQLAVRAGEASAELASDLKHVGRVSLSSTGESITFTPNTARYDYWVVDPVGNKFRLGRDGESDQSKVTFKQSVSIYPNPFNPATTFRVTLATPETISVKVFNLLGQEVAVLASGWHDTGEYAFPFNASTLASGVYVYQVQIGREVQTGKLQLLK